MLASTLGYSARRRGIGLTALIDVVFILLMFFMLTSSFNRWHAVAITGVISSKSSSDTGTPQIVFLGADQSLRLLRTSHRFVHYEQLTAANAPLFNADEPVIVVPEPNVILQDIVSLMDRLKSIGVRNVSYGGVTAQ